ncbi:MAG: hypothetical protein MJY49_04200 [Bacteroidales bacterium]|nr:hypothetical protein [Bacteroidales bacterium]
MLGVAVLAAFVSCKKETPAADVLEIINAPETVITKDGTDTPLTVTFKATKAWTASVDADYVTITPKSGDPADECKVKINVAANETTVDRSFTVTLKSEGVTPVTVTYKQESQFHLNIDPLEVNVPKAGGLFKINVDANVRYTIKDYSDGSFPWQHLESAGDTEFAIQIDANNGYPVRESYVKITTPDIQVPEIDPETGEPTGELVDMTVRVYFYQEGNASIAWTTTMSDDYFVGEGEYISLSSAFGNGMLLVSNGHNIWGYDAATGKALQSVPLEGMVTPFGITNDDAGHVVAFTGGSYPPAEGDPYEPLTVLSIDPTTMSGAPVISGVYNAFYGYGLDGMTVTGDITGNAAITFLSGAGWEAGSSLVFFQVTDGKFEGDSHTDYVGLPWTSALWSSRHSFGVCTTNNVMNGVLCAGYDGNYNLHYNPGVSGANWVETFTTGYTWEGGLNAADVIEWNGHKYLCFLGMSYFPSWAIPSSLFVLNIDNPAKPELLTKIDYLDSPEVAVSENTALTMTVEDGSLCAYIVDGEMCSIRKIILPVL